MIEIMQLAGLEELTGFLVADEGIVVPGVPQAQHHPGKLAGALITFAVLVVLLAAEVASLVFLSRRHQIPAGTAVA